LIEISTKEDIIAKLESFDVLEYGRSRNFLDGNVSQISPFISRGLISSKEIFDIILKKWTFKESQRFLQQVLWREYFYRVWEDVKDDIFTDLKKSQIDCKYFSIPDSVLGASTGIEVVDDAIKELYKEGYCHNHNRLYIASLVSNIGKYHWLFPAKWMYYHLLDGDIASNMLSWQWVVGTRSVKKYFANQENINHFSGTNQQDTFLDKEYEDLLSQSEPLILKEHYLFELKTILPEIDGTYFRDQEKVIVHNSYTLNPEILKEEQGVKHLLLLEPDHYKKYPVSSKVLDFTIALAKNEFNEILIQVDNYSNLKQVYPNTEFHYEEHITTEHYEGIRHQKNMISEPNAPLSSFYKFWNYHLKIWKNKS